MTKLRNYSLTSVFMAAVTLTGVTLIAACGYLVTTPSRVKSSSLLTAVNISIIIIIQNALENNFMLFEIW